ncbi:MAG: hypothetical protein ACPGQD_00640, partial [Planctomycetota bacterium]
HHPSVIGVFDDDLRTYTGFESHAAFDDLHASDPERGFIRGGVVGELNTFTHQPIAYSAVLAGDQPFGASWGAGLKERIRAFPRTLTLALIGEEMPMEEVVLTEEDETVDGGEEPGAEEQAAAAEELSGAVEAAARPVFRIDETTIATDPVAARERAGEELEVYATLVTRSDANWDRARADALEDILGRVLWHAADVELLDLARADLAKVDGLRRFYLSSLQGRERSARAAGRTAEAEVLAAQLAEERRPNRGDGETSVVVVGWLTREVLPGGQGSLRLQRGKSVFPLEDRDGLHDLPSLRGREIVVRGTWAERPRQVAADPGLAGLEGEDGGLLVLTVREFRVLPARAE